MRPLRRAADQDSELGPWLRSQAEEHTDDGSLVVEKQALGEDRMTAEPRERGSRSLADSPALPGIEGMGIVLGCESRNCRHSPKRRGDGRRLFGQRDQSAAPARKGNRK